MDVRFTLLSSAASVPAYAREGDAGMDISAISKTITDKYIEYGTGLAVAIPEGYVGLIFPRSSISNKELLLSNSVGVIDSNYRGEVKFRFKYNQTSPDNYYAIGDRVGQLIIMPYPRINLVQVESLDETNRNTNGFGSSGN